MQTKSFLKICLLCVNLETYITAQCDQSQTSVCGVEIGRTLSRTTNTFSRINLFVFIITAAKFLHKSSSAKFLPPTI